MEVQVINYAIRIELSCPKCGKVGIIFLSRRGRTDDVKFLNVYHGPIFCRVEKSMIDEVLNGYSSQFSELFNSIEVRKRSDR